jgi:23S rRNA (guanosine2251-2'-O)-methyltransferase
MVTRDEKPTGKRGPERGGRPARPVRKNAKPGRGPRQGRPYQAQEDGAAWIWGTHAAQAALKNPKRQILEIIATANASHALNIMHPKLRVMEPREIDSRLPEGAVHQGVALRAAPLPQVRLEDVGKPTEGVLLVLDSITDPRNAGAILRSAAAFGARGVVMQDRKSPPLSGGLAKSAVGAAETVPAATVVNLSKAVTELNERGWRTIGLAGDGDVTLAEAVAGADAVVFVLGSEDKGLRPSVREACAMVARIPITEGAESLNVSTAAAIALYEWSRGRA